MKGRKALRWIQSSIGKWFLTLLWLNILDILVTTPAYEANPFTLYLWGRIGIFLSAWVKIGLVLFLGALIGCAKKVATPAEWAFSRKLLRGILFVLIAFYVFVVLWNCFLFLMQHF
jgi:hypothetical protein